MAGIGFKDSSGMPFTREGMYATNNQFQKAGPKGFIQVKILENDDLYVRVDLPGVPDDGVRHRVDAVRQKIIFFSGETVDDGKDPVREYSGSTGLGCDCCEITKVDAKMKDGVLRMIVSRVKVKDHDKKCTETLPPFTGKSGRFLEDHPFVVKGRKRALTGEPMPDGGLFVALDIPGICPEDIEVYANATDVKFYAENKIVYEHDERSRVYLGSFGQGPTRFSRSMICNVEYGVFKITTTPLTTTSTTTTTTLISLH